VSETLQVNSLNTEYGGDQIYLSKIENLSEKYKAIRRTRPDGNCFFRAFAYAYLEYLTKNQDEYDRFFELAKDSKDKLVGLGFPKFTIEDFHDTVICLRMCKD
jgi:ubiquitin thioesterase protein OTUB1